MKQSTIDKYGRQILLFWGVVFAIVAYVLWKDVFVGHQWPDNLDGWIGFISTLLVSIVSLGYGIFYPWAKRKDNKLPVKSQEDKERRLKFQLQVQH